MQYSDEPMNVFSMPLKTCGVC